MGTTRLVTAAAMLLALAAPGFAQGRGARQQPSDGVAGEHPGSDRGVAAPREGPRYDAPAPPRSTLWSENARAPQSPFARGLVGGGLVVPRPGIDLFRAGPDTYAGVPGRIAGVRGGRPGWTRERSEGRRRNGTGALIYPVIGGFYGMPYAYGPYAPLPAVGVAPEVAAAATPTGFLRLVVTPRRAEVFVDGIYEGTVDDFGGTGERALPSGVHRVRLETEGFESVEFDVRIPDNDTITLRRDLYPRSEPPPVAPPVAPAGPPAAPKTIYVIPRCYLGDSPPLPHQLPEGCSVANLRTMP